MAGYAPHKITPLREDRPYYEEKHKRTKFGPKSKLPKSMKSGLGLQEDTLMENLGQMDMSGYTAAQNYSRLAAARSQHVMKQKAAQMMDA